MAGQGIGRWFRLNAQGELYFFQEWGDPQATPEDSVCVRFARQHKIEQHGKHAAQADAL
jgi:hypothetical protein